METRRGMRPACAGLAMFALAGTAAAAEFELPSCVPGSPPLRAAGTAPRAQLDPTDRTRFHAAAMARYPLYQRGGLVPAQVWMLQRGGQWQYVTLWPGGAGGLCVSAVFAADRFDFTPGWLGKYRPRAGAPDD